MFDPLTNNWTWEKGTGVPDDTGVYGVQAVPAQNNIPPAMIHITATWVDHNGDLWLYGGNCYYYNYSATMWRYNIASNMWTWMQGPEPGFLPVEPSYGIMGVESPANTPGSRIGCAGSWVDTSGNLWLYGGQQPDPLYSDFWKYDILTNNWVWMSGSNGIAEPASYGIRGIADTSNTPGARCYYYPWTDGAGNFWLFGGQGAESNFNNDMWMYNPSSNIWTWMSGTAVGNDSGSFGSSCLSDTGLEPSARIWGTMWKDNCGNFWLYGGRTSIFIPGNFFGMNDLWCFNPVSLKWTFVNGDSIASIPPDYGNLGIASDSNTPGARVLQAVGLVKRASFIFLEGVQLMGMQMTFGSILLILIAAIL